jgi:Zn-dependent protease
MSVVIHEISHGFAAEYFGDKTARLAGRLTLNPLKHLDPFGSVFLPAILALSHSPFLLGWAKPVPYNPDNLSDKKWGTVAVASAGVIANLFIAIIFGLLVRFSGSFDLPASFYTLAFIIIKTNLILAIFNLVPIPPLDGSKILFAFLPKSFYPMVVFLEQYALAILLVFILFFSNSLFPILSFMFSLITGVAF